MIYSQDKAKRRSFIVTVPVWTQGGRDVTLRLLREALNESFTFGDPETPSEKTTVRPYKETK